MINLTKAEQLKSFINKDGFLEIAARIKGGKFAEFARIKLEDLLQNNDLNHDILDLKQDIKAVYNNGIHLNTNIKNAINHIKDCKLDLKHLKNLSYIGVGLDLLDIGVSVAGFAIIYKKLNDLSSEISDLSIQLNQHDKKNENIEKGKLLNTYDNLVTSYEQFTRNVANNIKYDQNTFDKIVRNFKSFIKQIISYLNDEAIDKSFVLNILTPLFTAYTELISMYIREYYFNYNSWINLDLYLDIYNEMTSSDIRTSIFDYIYLNNDINSKETLYYVNTYSLIFAKQLSDILDDINLIKMSESEKNYKDIIDTLLDSSDDELIKELELAIN